MRTDGQALQIFMQHFILIAGRKKKEKKRKKERKRNYWNAKEIHKYPAPFEYSENVSHFSLS